jgi:hypothetical protein
MVKFSGVVFSSESWDDPLGSGFWKATPSNAKLPGLHYKFINGLRSIENRLSIKCEVSPKGF